MSAAASAHPLPGRCRPRVSAPAGRRPGASTSVLSYLPLLVDDGGVRRVGEDREAQENVLFAAHRQGIIIQMRRAVLAVALLMSLAPIDAAAQAPSSPRGTDIPRTREGKPDFTGIWQVINSAAWD